MLAVITVNSAGDNLTSDGMVTLREAIQAANTNSSVDGSAAGDPGIDTIRFDPAIFTGGIQSLIRLEGTELEITESLRIEGDSGVEVSVTGDSNDDDITDANNITDVGASLSNDPSSLDDNSRVLNFSVLSGNLEISGLIITGGHTAGDNVSLGGGQGVDTTYSGGGVRFASGGTLTLVGSLVSGNSTSGAAGYGGGVFSADGAVVVNSSQISENSISGNGGGGGGIATKTGEVSLIDSRISGNSTAGEFSSGGGIHTISGRVQLVQSTLSGNSTSGLYSYGGGINSFLGDVSLSHSSLSDNSTLGDYSWGGGLTAPNGMVSIVNSTVANNSTSGINSVAGGIHSVYGEIDLLGSTVSGNFTLGDGAQGGGIRSSYGDVTLTNSTVSGNHTSGENAWGGGIRTWQGDLSLASSTVTANYTTGTAAHGGGIFVRDSTVDAPLTILNSVVAGNTVAVGSLGPDIVPDPESTITIDHSLIGDNTDTGLPASPTADANGNLIGTSAAPIDPLLEPLADNGGLTHTHALLPSSPAIDAGDPNFATPESYAAEVLSDGPSIFLQFEETSGTIANDSSGNGHHGQYFGTPDLMTVGIGSDSITGLGLDGIDDFAGIDSAPISESFTAEAWAFSTTPTWNKFGWTAASNDPDGFIIHPNEGERSWTGYVFDNTGSFFAIDIHTPQDITGWHHYAITYDGTVGRMFFDGEMVAETPLSITRSSSTTIGINLGYDDCCPDERFGAGGIDEFALYPTALEPEAIARHYSVATAAADGSKEYDQRGFPFARVTGGRTDMGAFEYGSTSADFNENGSIDGSDFLAWQRGFGLAAPTHIDGDADYDGDVDASDLAAWTASYGNVVPTLVAGQSAVSSQPAAIEGTQLIDAAMAWDLAQEQSETSEPAATEGGDFDTEITLREKSYSWLPSVSEFVASELSASTETAETTEDDESSWLADELLERVFE